MTEVVNKIAYGLKWCTAINDGKKELESLVAEHKATFHTTAANSAGRMYGLSSAKKLNGTRSAAAIMATLLAETGGVFVHQITPDLACCIAIENGLPVPEMDEVGTRTDMIELAKKYVASRSDTDGKITIYGDADYSELDGLEYQAMDREIIEKSPVAAGKLVPASDKKGKAIIATMGVVAALGVIFSDDLIAMVQPQKPKVAPPTQQQIYHQQVQAAIEKIEIADQFRNDIMPAFAEFAGNLPFSVPGWEMDSIECIDTKCKATWQRTMGGSAEGILAALRIEKNDASVSFPTVDKLQKEMKFSRPVRRQPLEFSSNATLDPKVLTWVQSLKDRRYDPKYSTPIRLVVPPANVEPNKEDVVLVGEYTINVPYRELPDVVKLTNSMTVERIEVKVLEKKITASIQGKYYAR